MVYQENTRHTTVAIPVELMESVKSYRDTHKLGYATNSEVIRQAVREFLLKNNNGNGNKLCGSILHKKGEI